MKIAIVQLARLGDVTGSSLPIAKHLHGQGHEVGLVTCFPEAAEPASYVTTHQIETDYHDVPGAAAFAKKLGYEKIIPTTEFFLFQKAKQTRNYQLDQWCRSGFLPLFHELPLVMDRRDTEGESKAIERHLPAGNKPLLSYCLKSSSSPHDDPPEKWIIEAFGDKYRLLNLGGLNLDKPHHLLAFLERSVCLVSIDTYPIHLAYATGTPTVVMSKDAYKASEPRRHWIHHSFFGDDRQRIQGEISELVINEDFAPGRLVRPVEELPDLASGNIRHVVHGQEVDGAMVHRIKAAQRTSGRMGDGAAKPFFRDIIGWATEDATNGEIIAWTDGRGIDRDAIGRAIDASEVALSAGLFACRVGFWRLNFWKARDVVLGRHEGELRRAFGGELN